LLDVTDERGDQDASACRVSMRSFPMPVKSAVLRAGERFRRKAEFDEGANALRE